MYNLSGFLESYVQWELIAQCINYGNVACKCHSNKQLFIWDFKKFEIWKGIMNPPPQQIRKGRRKINSHF